MVLIGAIPRQYASPVPLRPDTPSGAASTIAVALGAGVFGAIQPEVNAELGERVGSSLVASLVNFAVALVVVVVVVRLRPSTRRRLRGVRSWPVPWWTFTAGFGGATIVVAGAVAVDTIGVAIFSAFFTGQITFGLLTDRLGVAPGGRRPVTTPRVQAVALAVAAIALAQLGRSDGEFELALVALSVVGGAGVAFQSAFNGRIAWAIGDPFAATFVNVTVGTAALTCLVGALAVTDRLGGLDFPSEPWLYTGGALGASIVLSLAVATAALGVLRATLTMLGAQLVTAFAVDWLIRGDAPRAGAVTGAFLLVAAMALVGRGSVVVAARRAEEA